MIEILKLLFALVFEKKTKKGNKKWELRKGTLGVAPHTPYCALIVNYFTLSRAKL